MKEYKVVHLNKGINFGRGNDLQQVEDVINEFVAHGWTLQQVVSPSDGCGVLVGIFYREF